MFMSLFTTSLFAQEVRGVETRLAEYYGDKYPVIIDDGLDNYFNRPHYKSEYYGFEFTNKNSIRVSVEIEVYRRNDNKDTNEPTLVTTKEIVLAPNEKYIMKYPVLRKYDRRDGKYTWENHEIGGKNIANSYYVKYKAYKLQ